MKHTLGSILSLVFVLSVTSNAGAATVVCDGTVELLAYHQPGNLMVRLSSMNVPVMICSTDVEWVVAGSLSGNTSTAACKAIYSTLLAAKMTGASMGGVYFDGNQVPASCNSFSPWSQANLRYFQF